MQIMLSLFKVFGPRATRAILGVGLSALIGLASVDVQRPPSERSPRFS